MKYHYFEQGSEEWLMARLAIPTASEFSSIVTPKKLEPAKDGAVTYMDKLIAEWMHGAPIEVFVSKWQERGKELEPEAVRYYEMEKDMGTDAVGFVTTDDGMAGASPDRLVGDVGLYEGKAPGLQAHVHYMRDKQALLMEYRIQHQGQLWVCQDREWVDMQSYHPGKPTVIVRTYRDDVVQKALDTHIPAFIEAMLRERERLTQEYGELRRERVTAAQRTAASHAAFDEYMSGGIGGAV